MNNRNRVSSFHSGINENFKNQENVNANINMTYSQKCQALISKCS